jgi:hypothetical protein
MNGFLYDHIKRGLRTVVIKAAHDMEEFSAITLKTKETNSRKGFEDCLIRCVPHKYDVCRKLY